MNTLFNYMNYEKTKIIHNSMFEQDVDSNFTYNDLSRSKYYCHNTYDDLTVNDIEIHIDNNIKCILSKLS